MENPKCACSKEKIIYLLLLFIIFKTGVGAFGGMIDLTLGLFCNCNINCAIARPLTGYSLPVIPPT